jgi:hypothetical protein
VSTLWLREFSSKLAARDELLSSICEAIVPEAPKPRRGGPITGKAASQVVPLVASRWSHPRGKTGAELVPSSWQPTGSPAQAGGHFVLRTLGTSWERCARQSLGLAAFADAERPGSL